MDVSGTHGVSVEGGEERTGGTVGRQGVGGGLVAVEPVLALLVAPELSAQVVGRLVVRVLEVVLAVGRGLPDVDDGAGDGLLGVEVGDDAVHEGDLAVGGRVLDDGAAVLAEGGVGGPEGAEDGGRGGLLARLVHVLVCDLVDEGLEAQNVGHAVCFVAGGGRGLADEVDELDAGHPLVDGELDLAGEVVEVADQRGHDDAEARVSLGAHGVDDSIGEVGVEAVLGAVLLRLGCRLLGAGGHCGCV